MEMETINIHGTGNFQFSGVTPGELENDEYTLVVIADDVSPSTGGIRGEACEAKKMIIDACRKSPRAENLLIRMTTFGSSINEVHGYKPLSEIDESQYKPEKSIGHSTALYDATYDAVVSALDYAQRLDNDQDILSNAIVFIITDGMDNDSSKGASSIASKIQASRISEEIESIRTVLIGISDPAGGWSSSLDQYLQDFEKEAKLDQYVPVAEATASKLAKLAEFVSQSISSQSQSLGSGGPSQGLTF